MTDTTDHYEPLALGARWVSAETRQVMTSADAGTVSEAGQAIEALERIIRAAPATLNLMRQYAGGTTGIDAVPWCWTHQQPTSACRSNGDLCDGEAVTGAKDPTGETAINSDEASHHRRTYIRLLRQVAATAQHLDSIAACYPGTALPDEAQRPGPGPEHCQSCWEADGLVKEIERRGNGQPYYRGLCRRCGQWRSKLTSSSGMALPAWFVRRLNAKEPITPAIEAKARKAMQGKRKKGKK